jgi:acyl carrier protein
MSESHDKYAFSQTEIIVGEIWAEALQIDKVDPVDNFFEQGGDSLTTMMMMFRVSDVLNVDMTPDALLEAPTLREFCQAIDDKKSAQYTADADYAETGVI